MDFRQGQGVPPESGGGIECHKKLGDGHGQPQGIAPGQCRQNQSQPAADDQASGHGHHKRRPGLHDGLEIVGGENIEGQQQEGHGVGADDTRSHGQDFRGGRHENPDIQPGTGHAEHRPEHPEKGRRAQSQPENLPDAPALARAEVGGHNGLSGLAYAVGAALGEGADLDHRPVNGQGVGSQVAHDLPVEEHRKDAHGHVHEKRGKTSDENFPEPPEKPGGSDKPQGVLPAEKMGQHHAGGNGRADGRGQTRAKNAHITAEYKENIAENVENSPGQYCQSSPTRIAVGLQKEHQHLIDEKQREHEFHRPQVGLCQRQQLRVRAEEGQDGGLEAPDAEPGKHRQHRRADDRGGKILIFRAVPGAAAPAGAENHAAARAQKQTQAIDQVPTGSHYRQSRGTLRPLVLTHHRRVHHGVDAADEGTAEGRRQIFSVHRSDISVEKIHIFLL